MTRYCCLQEVPKVTKVSFDIDYTLKEYKDNNTECDKCRIIQQNDITSNYEI